MAYLKIDVIKSINNYSGGLPILVAEFEVDDVASLPAQNQTTYSIGIGSVANVISNGSKYKMQSSGTWVLQPSESGGGDGYTKAEVDALIQDTKDYADGEILGAINDLDVSAVGGTTKYIYSISQADGKISASAYTSDSAPTTGSTKLVQSGGVKTYVDDAKTAANNYTDTAVSNKITLADVFGQGTRIQGTSDNHEDLDNYWTAGNYHILTATDADYVDNKPNDPDFAVSDVRARVLVFQFSGTTETNARCFQIYIRARTNASTGTGCFYIRYRYISSNTPGWTSWFKIDGTILTSNLLQSVNPIMSVNSVNSINEVDEVTDEEIDDEMR